MATFLTLTAGHVEYATRTKIMELSLEIAESYSLLKVKSKIRLVATLLRYLRALQADSTLTFEERQAIYQVLIKLAGLYHIPTAPTVTTTRIVNILFGQPGNDGAEGPPGPAGSGFPYFANTGVSAPLGIVDSLDKNDCEGCSWNYYVVGGGVGEGRRSGWITANWNATTDTITSFQWHGDDLDGTTTPVSFSVDIASGLVRLIANVTTPNWIIRGARYQMQDLIV
jgi:hypothetical protein